MRKIAHSARRDLLAKIVLNGANRGKDGRSGAPQVVVDRNVGSPQRARHHVVRSPADANVQSMETRRNVTNVDPAVAVQQAPAVLAVVAVPAEVVGQQGPVGVRREQVDLAAPVVLHVRMESRQIVANVDPLAPAVIERGQDVRKDRTGIATRLVETVLPVASARNRVVLAQVVRVRGQRDETKGQSVVEPASQAHPLDANPVHQPVASRAASVLQSDNGLDA